MADIIPKESTDEKEMSFLDHLEELRWHIIRSILAVVAVAIVVFLAKEFVFETIIFGPKKDWFPTYQFFCSISDKTCFKPPKFDLITREMGEQFFVHLKVSIWMGVIIAFPLVFWEFWKFIKPGLYDTERKAASGVVFVCSFLFSSGVLFGYYVIAPFAITFLANYSVGLEAVTSPTLASYVNYLTMFTIPTGVLFELPIVVYFLTKIGLITPQFMRNYRRHAVIIILIMAAIITPPDIVTQFLIGIPVFILYEISILISKRTLKMKQKNGE